MKRQVYNMVTEEMILEILDLLPDDIIEEADPE